ncbi:AbrB/MazE/SpoVT family DNA-binding domain-containing protein [Motilimonas eburnea]|uniref:AbrB/MazE/SpoVT family DNA-binding domain-containing protein n=1 Tax=Motilimonas eburnea TaxID=1737488 RepID=UPI001E38434E|nr:AbrB/MazE/SpoVT family DNA-binding domain-containing protein [Motilimonas eburnea]MCE2571853.1 AbrB/MazE/SpoVT family DNA-binding domain-containing protein [Motilimonas eburnea]
METSIRNIGNSKGVVIPKKLLDELNADTGDKMNMTVEDGKFVMCPVKSKPRYKLADLLAQCDDSAPMPEELTEWNNAQSVGKEI